MRNTAGRVRADRAHRSVLTTTTALVGAMALAACGSSSGDSSAAPDAGGASAGGAPIVVQAESNLTGQSTPYPILTETAKAYEHYINAKGGINGRPLKVVICDNKGDAAAGAQCAREAAKEKVVAVVGSYNADASREIPIYEQSKIAWFGAPAPVAQVENTSKVSFAFNFISGSGTAAALQMVADGCKNPVGMYLDYPFTDNFVNAFANGWKSAGQPASAIHTVKIPATATDFSAPAGKAASFKPDCVWGGIVGETNWPSLITAMEGVGVSPRFYGNQGNLSERVATQFPEQTSGGHFFGAYSDISGPEWDDYRAALKSSKADASLDYNALAGLGTWAAFVGFTNIVKDMQGEINNETFLDAASKTTNLSTDGLLPPLDLSKEWTGGGGNFPRAFNRFVQYGTLEDGKVVAGDNKPIDVSDAFDGKPSSGT